MGNENNNIEKIEINAQFPLFGETICISPSVKKRANAESAFEDIAVKLSKEFASGYDRGDKCDGNYVYQIYNLGMEKIRWLSSALYKYFIGLEIYNIDEEKIISGFSKCAEAHYISPFEELEETIQDIIAEASGKMDERRLAKENRGRWSGGGFGLNGAIKGAIMAGGLNAVSGAAHSLAGGAANIVTSAGMKKEIKRAYNQYKNKIINGLYYTIKDSVIIYIKLAKEYLGSDIKDYNIEEIKECNKVFAAIKTVGISNKTLVPFIKNIERYPINKQQYELLLLSKGDASHELDRICNYLKIDILSMKHKALQDEIESMKKSKLSVDDFLRLQNQIKDRCEFYGYEPNDIVNKVINECKKDLMLPDNEEKLAENIKALETFKLDTNVEVGEIIKKAKQKYDKIYSENRTVTDIDLVYDDQEKTYKIENGNDFLLANIEMTKEAKKKLELLRKTYKDSSYKDEKEMQYILHQAEHLYETYGLCKGVILSINSILQDIDIKERTVLDTLYDTREEADEERKKVYNGKKYDSQEEAMLTEKECEHIKDTFSKCGDLISRYDTFFQLSSEPFFTTSAVELMEEHRNSINHEYDCMLSNYLDIGEIMKELGKSFLQIIVALGLTAIGIW